MPGALRSSAAKLLTSPSKFWKGTGVMSTASRIMQMITEGLVFGFTFALGWIAAVVVAGAFVA